MRKLILRCQELKLVSPPDPVRLHFELAAYLATLATRDNDGFGLFLEIGQHLHGFMLSGGDKGCKRLERSVEVKRRILDS